MGFRIAQLAELGRQMTFTPLAKRGVQLAAAEELLFQIDPAKAYPFDFIVFRITEYHRRVSKQEMAEGEFTGQLLTGLALQHDLGLLIENVSDSLNEIAAGQQVLTSEQAARRYHVSRKTIQRDRRRGLPGHKFIFPGGKKRIGFFAVSADRFFRSRRTADPSSADYSEIGQVERAVIARTFKRLVARGCSVEEISDRIARRLGRSPLIVRQVAVSDLSELLASAAPRIRKSDRRRIVHEFRQGATLKDLAIRYGCPRSSIHRAIARRRLARLNKFNGKFFDDALYHQADAEEVVDHLLHAEELAAPVKPEDERVPAGLPANLSALCRTPLLTAGRERALFLKLNYHKFRFSELKRQLARGPLHWRKLNQLQSHRRTALRTRNAIVAANLRLVISIARRHVRGAGDNLTEWISDGCVAMMRAVNGFDFHRGNRFSTYATFALMKEYARGIPAARTRARRDGDSSLLPRLADPVGVSALDRAAQRDQIAQLLSHLDEREQTVLRAYYGIDGGRAASYDEVGRRLGMSAPCVQRIERKALEKLRKTAGGR